MLKIIEASITDIDTLNGIAMISEGYWGHSEKMMAKFKQEYSLSHEYFKMNKIFNLVLNNVVIGFYAFNLMEKIPVLEYFYLRPEYIGYGYGRRLWEGTLSYCRRNDIHMFEFVAGPEVRSYYLKMGAEVIENGSSKLDSKRKIYKFLMRVENS